MISKQLVSNDHITLTPKTSFDGPELIFDFPALKIGVAEYDEGPTGCTVFYFPKGVSTAVDTRGGAVGASETGYGWHNAICFAGGSLMGIESFSGVRAEILAQGDYHIDWESVPLVGGAIIWDRHVRDNAIYPDKKLGRAALKAAKTGSFPLGPRGAGRSATVRKWLPPPHKMEFAGQGGATFEAGSTRVLMFTVVNAIGAIINPRGRLSAGTSTPRRGSAPKWRILPFQKNWQRSLLRQRMAIQP